MRAAAAHKIQIHERIYAFQIFAEELFGRGFKHQRSGRDILFFQSGRPRNRVFEIAAAGAVDFQSVQNVPLLDRPIPGRERCGSERNALQSGILNRIAVFDHEGDEVAVQDFSGLICQLHLQQVESIALGYVNRNFPYCPVQVRREGNVQCLLPVLCFASQLIPSDQLRVEDERARILVGHKRSDQRNRYCGAAFDIAAKVDFRNYIVKAVEVGHRHTRYQIAEAVDLR